MKYPYLCYLFEGSSYKIIYDMPNPVIRRHVQQRARLHGIPCYIARNRFLRLRLATKQHFRGLSTPFDDVNCLSLVWRDADDSNGSWMLNDGYSDPFRLPNVYARELMEEAQHRVYYDMLHGLYVYDRDSEIGIRIRERLEALYRNSLMRAEDEYVLKYM